MIFERARLERLFDFAYRIEIYVPEPKRSYGYYVYPFLLDEKFVARRSQSGPHAWRAAGQCRLDRAGLRLVVVATELASELKIMAEWLGLETLQILPGTSHRFSPQHDRRTPSPS